MTVYAVVDALADGEPVIKLFANFDVAKQFADIKNNGWWHSCNEGEVEAPYAVRAFEVCMDESLAEEL